MHPELASQAESQARKRYDLVVVGDLNADLILRGDVIPAFGQAEKLVEDATLTIGSSAAIFSCGAARLGLRVAFIGKVGEDEFGRFMLRSLALRDVDTSGVVVDPGIRTGLSVILSRRGDRAILTYPGSIPELRFSEISHELIAQSRHLHLGSYFLLEALRPDVPALFDQAHQAGLTVSLDTNYDPQENWDSGVQRALQRADIFLPNEVECRLIAKIQQTDLALQSLAQQVDVVAVKLGAQGALAQQGSHTAREPAIPVEVVDTVGAGDSFDAGFIYGYLAGWDLQKSLRMGVVCGALSLRLAGGTQAQATFAEAAAYLAA
jgi:sugar/nucleoside kinase (ribokinase family)